MDVTSNRLSLYLDQILNFLIHNAKSQVFPGLTMAMEDILVQIAKDANYLKNGMFDDDCKSQAARIITELEKNKEIYTLTYAFENYEHCKKVMVYKKTPVPFVMEPLGLKQLRKPRTIPGMNVNACANTNTVMSSFKTSSLNATLKFVKDESRLILQYPDMSTEQAEFVKQMITQCMTQTNEIDKGPGSKGLFDPLAEALKIFGLKNEFKLSNAVPTSFDMKSLVFEKIPKQRKSKIENDQEKTNEEKSTSSEVVSHKMKQMQPLLESVQEKFEMQSFVQIRDFIADASECLTFENISVMEEQFLTSWKMYVKPEIITCFSKEVQTILYEIRDLIKSTQGKFTVRTTMEQISKTHRTVYLEKKWTTHPENAILRTRNTEQKPMPVKSAPTTKLNKDIAEVNNNKPLNTMAIAKVNTVTKEVNVAHSKIPLAKVNTVTKEVNVTHSNIPIAKLNKDIAEVNNNKPLNSMPIAKVNTLSLKVNTQENSIPKAKVNTRNSVEVDENTTVDYMFLKHIDKSIELNTQFNSILTEKVKTENRYDLDTEDFIATRLNIGTCIPIKPRKQKPRSLMITISEIDGKFARHAITDLKNFISDTKETLSFKDLRREEWEFLLGWEDIIKRVEVIRMFSIPGQMALDELRTMVDMCSGKFKIVVESKTASPINRTVTFKKQRIKKKKANPASGTTPEFSDELPISNISLSSNSKTIEFLKTFEGISQSWIKNTLKQLIEFLKDDFQASLLVPNITPPQKDFLMKWQSLTRGEVMDCFREDVQGIMKDISLSVLENAHRFVVSCKVTKMTKNHTRDATFIKMPCFPLTPSQKEKKKEIVNTKDTTPEKSKPKNNGSKTEIPDKSRRLRELENGLAEKNQPTGVRNKDESLVSAIAPDKSDASRMIPKAASVTSLPVVKSRDDDNRGRPKSATTAKEKMIEALNQPLVSERGLKYVNRMMRMMGWDGGALGVRGDGIVEPIALNLDVARRAGLGAVKPTPKPKIYLTSTLPANIIQENIPNSSQPDVMRTMILQAIKKMLISSMEDFALELISPAKFTKRTWKFIRQLLTALNSRSTTIDLPESQILLRVMNLIKKTDLMLTACCGASQKNILFVLSKFVYQPSEVDSEKWFSIISVENVPKLRKVERNDENIVVDGDAFKDYVMAQILKFCEIPIGRTPNQTRISQEIQLRGTMAPKQMSYIQDVVIRLNSRSRASSDRRQAIFNEIAMTMKGFNLNVDFPTTKSSSDSPVYKCIRLYKIFYEKHTTSSDKSTSGTADKVNINSMVSINKLLSKTETSETDNIYNTQNHKNKDESKEKGSTNVTCDDSMLDDQNAPKSSKNSPIDSQDAPIDTQIALTTSQKAAMGSQSSQIAPMTSQNENNVDSKGHRRTTFTSDTFDEKCLFNNQNSPIDSQGAPIDTQIAPTISQNAAMGSQSSQIAPMISQSENNVDSKGHRRTTFTSDTFDEKCLFDNQNSPIDSQDAPIDTQIALTTSQNAAMFSQSSQMAPMTSQHENNVDSKGHRRTTFTSDTFDGKCLFENQNSPYDSQDEPIDTQIALTTSQNAAMDSQIAPMTSQNTAMGSQSSQIAPMTSQNVAMGSQSSQIAPMTSQNDLFDDCDRSIFNYCLCCVQDCSSGANVAKNGDNIDRYMEEETNATVNTGTDNPIYEKEKDNHRQDGESYVEGLQNIDGLSMRSVKRVQYFNINGLKILIDDYISNMKCTEDVKKTLTEFKDHIFIQITKKQKLERPKGNLDQNSNDKVLGKRLRSNPSTPNRNVKKFKNSESVIKISVTPKNYPQSKITDEMAGEIQKSILNSIDYIDELPLLECHGIQDGALVYTCHNKQSFNLIDSLKQSMHLQVNIQERGKTCHRMTVRINSFIDESIDTILKRLETYNMNLYTKDWKVLFLEKTPNFVVIHAEIDDSSFELVVKENFALYAGIDQAKFNIVWD